MIILRPQDIVVLLKIVVARDRQWTYSLLSYELFISKSQIYFSIKRAGLARLINSETKEPFLKPLEEFLIHGVKYAYPLQRGEIVRGIKTTYAAPPLSLFINSTDKMIPVWPDPEGDSRGYSVPPLHKNVPKAALIDPLLYELLSLVDAIREGGSRETKIATEELKKRLQRK